MDRDDRRLDAIYRVQGKSAAYTPPGGAAADCTVQFYEPLRDRHTIGVELGGYGAPTKPRYLLVRTSEVAQPVPDGVFALTGTTLRFRVGQAPILHDMGGKEWCCSIDDDT